MFTRPDRWGSLHDLGLLYLALVHGADGDIDPAEREVMLQKLQAWEHRATPAQTRGVMHDVMLVYMGLYRGEMLDIAIAGLKQSLQKAQRILVLRDLTDLASADGLLVPGEIAFIQKLAHVWEIDQELGAASSLPSSGPF